MINYFKSSLSSSTSPHSGELVGIQYLRGIAASAVVIDHAASMAALDHYFSHELAGGFLARGAVGVQLFFVISGFIIGLVALSDELAPRLSIGDFFLRRFIRVIPLMWTAVLLYSFLRAAGRGDLALGEIAKSLVLWPIGELDPNVIWTLRHEVTFYVIFGLTYLGPRSLRWSLWLWISLPLVLQFALPYQDPSSAPAVVQAISTLVHPVNLFFGAGLLCSFWWHKRGKASRLGTRLPAFTVAILSFVLLMLIAEILDFSTRRVGIVLASAVACAGMVCIAAKADFRGNNNRFGLLLGSASYSIYLFHPHVLSALLGFWARFAPATNLIVVVASVSAIAIAAGVMVHITLEKALIAFTKRVLSRKTLPEAGRVV